MTPEQIALELRENALNSLKNNNYKQAQSYFCQAAQSWPHLLPQIMLDLEHLINKNPGHIGLRLLTAGFYLYLNQLDSAMIELQETIEEKPDCVEAYNLLGKIYIQQDKVDETIELLEFSLAQGVQDVSLSEILAGAYLEKGRISEAITFYNKVRISRPNDKNILRMLGDLYYRIEDFNHAAECYRDMFSDDPQVSTEVIQRLEKLLKKREGSIFIREILATIYMKSLRPAEAIQKIREIIGLDSVKADDAVAQLKNIIKNYPEHADANQTLAEI